MNKVLFFANFSENQYRGGVINVITQYISSNNVFERYNFSTNFLNPNIRFSKNRIISTFQKVFFPFREKRIVDLYFKNNEKPEYFHIHTSRGWIFNNDLKLARYIAKKYKIKVALSVHHADVENTLSKVNIVRKRQISIINDFCSCLILLSKKTLNDFVDAGVKPHIVHLLYTFHSVNQTSKPEFKCKKTINLLFAGLLDKRKGILDLISAIELSGLMNSSKIHLNICGGFVDKSIENKVIDITSKANNICYLGYVQGEKKKAIFEDADILVLPSYGEGMPIVIMEAMAYGCAVVSTNVGAIPEIINNDRGVIINPGDVDALSNAIMLLLKNQDKLISMKESCFEEGKKHSLTDNIANLCRIYEGVSNDK